MIELILELFGEFALGLSADNKVSKPVRTFFASVFFMPIAVFFGIISIKMLLDSAVLLGLVFGALSLICIGTLFWLCQKIYKKNL